MEDKYNLAEVTRRTIADLENCPDVQPQHIAEAVGYRRLDRKV